MDCLGRVAGDLSLDLFQAAGRVQPPVLAERGLGVPLEASSLALAAGDGLPLAARD